MSLEGGNKAPEIKSTPVTFETARILNSVFKQLFGLSDADFGDWNFKGGSFGVCPEGLQVYGLHQCQCGIFNKEKGTMPSLSELAAARECRYVSTDRAVSILIPWRLFTEAFIILPLRDLMALVGNQVALNIVFEKPVIVGEGGDANAPVDAAAETDPASAEQKLMADQVGRQVDAALARRGNDGSVESNPG